MSLNTITLVFLITTYSFSLANVDPVDVARIIIGLNPETTSGKSELFNHIIKFYYFFATTTFFFSLTS